MLLLWLSKIYKIACNSKYFTNPFIGNGWTIQKLSADVDKKCGYVISLYYKLSLRFL